MIIDPIDLKLIRQLELHGSISTHDIIGKFGITEDEILLRIKNFEEAKFISGYGLKFFIPSIAGGRWYWGCVACETTSAFKAERCVPLLEEIVENIAFPTGVCPDVSLLFYTQNLKNSYRKLNKTSGIKYAEVYKIGEYNVRVKSILLKNDWQLISELFESIRKINYDRIDTLINAPRTPEDIGISRLIWTNKNRRGILSIFPNFNWNVIRNYCHLHVAVTTRIRIKDLRKIANNLGCSGNITARFKKRYIQLEFDIWGFADMHEVLHALKDVNRVSIEGYSFAYKNRIYNDWLEDYIKNQM